MIKHLPLISTTAILLASTTLEAQTIRTERFSNFKAHLIDASGAYHSRLVLENRWDTAKISLKNVVSEPITELPAGVLVHEGALAPVLSYGVEKKKLIAGIKVPLYLRENGQLRKISSFEAEILESPAPKVQARTYTAQSVLATGNWYKLGVTQGGLVKIDYNALQAMGINPANVNPANIRIYGNGGTVMNEKVDDADPDDLVENAIEVHASGNSFGPSDYILFYANGPLKWTPNQGNNTFSHTQNIYSDQSFYFLNTDLGPGLRVSSATPVTGTASAQFDEFDAFQVIEQDTISIGHIGKQWLGHEIYRNSQIDLPVNLTGATGPVVVEMAIAGKVDVGTASYSLKDGNTNIGSGNIAQANQSSKIYYRNSMLYGQFTPSSATPNLRLSVTANSVNARVYLDYLKFNYKKALNFTGANVTFRNFEQKTRTGLVSFKLGGDVNNLRVWDVSNPLRPKQVTLNNDGSGKAFLDSAGTLKEYFAFNGASFIQPTFVGTVANQNLHGLSQVKYLIITNDDLAPAAEQLANLHRNKYGTSTHVVRLSDIYNEFSSGGQDIGGIRNFIKMFYDRGNGTSDLENVLLFGLASFDYKNRVPNNTNFVPTFSSSESTGGVNTYATDEFFTLLDEGENVNVDGNQGAYVDVGIGRIPAKSLQEAQDYVAKIQRYIGAEGFGEWKNNSTFVTDDYEPQMGFLESGERLSGMLRSANSTMSTSKLYTDAAPRVATASGIKFPSVTRDINNQINSGTFVINYVGHGSPQRWAVEELLYQGDVSRWSNGNKLPIFITATCDFSRFDNPLLAALGVDIIMKKDGGGIAALTTIADVYPGPNDRLNDAYVYNQFHKQDDGTFLSFGEAFRVAKNEINLSNPGSFQQNNSKKFVVLGDPALSPALPVNNVVHDAVFEDLGNGVLSEADTLKALGKYVLKGHISDKNGALMPDFNGQVFVTIYDKQKVASVSNPNLLNSSNSTDLKSYTLQNNILFKGNASVENGEYNINVVIPKDINYDFGSGRIVFYAHDNNADAAGNFESITVGGFSEHASTDNQGPIVKPFIDNNLFRSGDLVSPNPMLYVELADDNGINISGSSVGHDLIAILDGDYENPYILNSFYKTEPNNYTEGSLLYQLERLQPGKHTITVRAWDVHNNSGEGSIEFEVRGADSVDFNLYNFPNPFDQGTKIVLQHNQANVDFEASLRIFNTRGSMVYQATEMMKPTGSFTTWDWAGVGNDGAKLAAGTYFYQVNIKTKEKQKTLYRKLVIAR